MIIPGLIETFAGPLSCEISDIGHSVVKAFALLDGYVVLHPRGVKTSIYVLSVCHLYWLCVDAYHSQTGCVRPNCDDVTVQLAVHWASALSIRLQYDHPPCGTGRFKIYILAW